MVADAWHQLHLNLGLFWQLAGKKTLFLKQDSNEWSLYEPMFNRAGARLEEVRGVYPHHWNLTVVGVHPSSEWSIKTKKCLYYEKSNFYKLRNITHLFWCSPELLWRSSELFWRSPELFWCGPGAFLLQPRTSRRLTKCQHSSSLMSSIKKRILKIFERVPLAQPGFEPRTSHTADQGTSSWAIKRLLKVKGLLVKVIIWFAIFLTAS